MGAVFKSQTGFALPIPWLAGPAPKPTNLGGSGPHASLRVLQDSPGKECSGIQ